MKTILAVIFFTLLTAQVQAQITGEALYTTTINMHMGLPNNEKGQRMKEWIPEFQEFNTKLIFSTTQTLYKNIHEDVPPDLDEEQKKSYWMKRRMAPPNDVIFCDLEEGTTVATKEFMDKTFLIKDTLNLASWKITGEQQEFAGMNCLKASYIPEEGDTTTIDVWFTPEIPISSGPEGFGGLPGLIVHLNMNEGQKIIALTSLIQREIEKGEIEEPTKGKVMTLEEFEEMRKKKMEERKKQWEGKGGYRGGKR
ncbi:MAG: GLPGLI family protein [Crocinitomicaceae bacterium]|nr:GLPGLI family protein [Crocinitomicaceae bacterium]